MEFLQTLHLNRICIDPRSQSKTAVLLKISQLLSPYTPTFTTECLFDAYWKRESMGSTTIGQGITIPHVRLEKFAYPLSCFIKLLNPIDFGAEDKQPIDLVIGLAVPSEQANQHLQLLSSIIKQFKVPAFQKACRSAAKPEELYKLLSYKTLATEML